MDTNARAKALSTATGISHSNLIGILNKELGDPKALDEFVKYGDIFAKANPISPILHIVSGNTPEAAIQSVTRGLLVGAKNLVKLPRNGIKEFHDFLDKLPSEMLNLVETSSERETSNEWIDLAQVIIIFGSDETVIDIASRTSPLQTIISHNHKVSFAVVDKDDQKEAADLAARDINKYDQMGCLSPHCIYVNPKEQPRSFAARLAKSLDKLNKNKPPKDRDIATDAQIDHLRRSYEFRGSNDTSVQIWKSNNNTNWTVVYEDEPQFAQSPLGQFVFVKPMPENLIEALSIILGSISTIAIYPFSLEMAKSLAHIGATRYCPLGSSQNPSIYWHHDGCQSLAPLVSWQNAG